MTFNHWRPVGGPHDQQQRAIDTRRRILQEKLDMIASYIAAQALRPEYSGNIQLVPCPDRNEWNRLAAGGRHAQLPPTAPLMMSFHDSLRIFAAERGITDTLVAWFEAARSQLIAARQAEATRGENS